MNWHFEQLVDLRKDARMLCYPDPLMVQGDNLAHEWRVRVFSGCQPMNLTGYTITGYFNRSDGKTVPVIGTANGSTATVVLPQSVYVASGSLTGLLRAAKGNEVITLAAGHWIVRHGPGNEIVDPGHVVPSLDELLAKIGEMEGKTNAASAAAQAANTAADNADSKANLADQAAKDARTAAKSANAQANAANTATGNANTAASHANTATDNANTAAGNANEAAANANAAASNADTAAGKANTATDKANTATGNANAAADKANAVSNRLSSVDMDLTVLPPNAEPTASVEQSDTKTIFRLGIPKGDCVYATFEVDENMDLLMHAPEGFDGINFALNDGVLEVTV